MSQSVGFMLSANPTRLFEIFETKFRMWNLKTLASANWASATVLFMSYYITSVIRLTTSSSTTGPTKANNNVRPVV